MNDSLIQLKNGFSFILQFINYVTFVPHIFWVTYNTNIGTI